MPDGRALKHVQVREYVRSLVTGNAPGSPAPSERELVHRFGVARMTVRQAMDALVVEGLLERIPGRGTFVARPRRMPSPISGFNEEMARRGLLARVADPAGPPASRPAPAWPGRSASPRATRSSTGAGCVAPTASRCASRTPTSTRSCCPASCRAGMPTSLYDDLVARGLRPTWAEDSIAADIATDEEADLLEVAPGSAGAAPQPPRAGRSKVVEVSRSVYRADRFTLWVQLGQDA